MTSFNDIYEIFSQKISDIKLLKMDDKDVSEMLYGWMKSASHKYIKTTYDLTDRDNSKQCFNFDLPEFEQEMLACYMVNEWLEPQLNSTLLTSQVFGSNEEKFYAQANQMDKLIELSERNHIDVKKLIRDRGYQDFLKG